MFLIRSGAIERYEQLVSEMGQNPNELLGQVGLTIAQVRQPNSYIAYPRLADLLDLSADACNEPLFGLRLAARQTMLALGEMALSASQQETLQDSLSYAEHHIVLHAHGVSVSQHINGEQLELHLAFDFSNSSGLRQLMQLSAGQAFNTVWQMVQGAGTSLKIHLLQSRPEGDLWQSERYADRLVFNSHFCGISFPASWLSRKPCPDEALIREHFRERIRQLESLYPDNLQAQVRHIVSNLLASGECDVTRVAATLDLHPRVLQKKLQAQGVTFRELLQETRMEIAELNLRFGRQSITDLALNLGYADVAVFSRNFKQWTGMSPRQWRKENRETGRN
ncbi:MULTISPECIES: AraC family transcriptional regulator [unclassified Microbulbifer]|uniref:helix-turn-helix transcriptional regulator n=1 Tax=unclassified Microbulbifer TaxID=2619833 RepID=UPI001E43BCD0|nr:AraC family transcriptional regulator [Microbulbifer sp. YPW16]UHQ54930.1 AraC family transcriptional regulator [Microbulbifer sp. YPW16]